MLLSPNEAAWCLLEVKFTPDEARRGVATGWAESELDTEARGEVLGSASFKGNMDLGWLQVSNYWHYSKLLQLSDWRDPLVNAKLARLVFLEKEAMQVKAGQAKDGWKAWKGYWTLISGVWQLNPRYIAALPFADVAMKAPLKPPGVRDLLHSELSKLRLELAA